MNNPLPLDVQKPDSSLEYNTYNIVDNILYFVFCSYYIGISIVVLWYTDKTG